MESQKTPRVSIVVPVYKTEKYLSRCIESVLNQTVQDLELILVDDGSPDNCGRICDSYALEDKRVKVIHTSNCGVSHARNTGLENARGEFLIFVDSDDWIERNHIEQLLPTGDEDLVYGGMKLFVNSHLREERPMPSITVERDEWISDYGSFAERGLVVFFITPCYRMKLIREHGIRFNTDLGVSEDGLFNLTYQQYCRKIRYSDACTYCYEDGDSTSESLSHRFHSNRMDASILECRMVERMTSSKEYLIRWRHWQIAFRHYRYWCGAGTAERRKEARQCLKLCFRNPYFRESIPYIRTHGTLDMRLETYFMQPWLHPLYQHVYRCVAALSRLKNKIIRHDKENYE